MFDSDVRSAAAAPAPSDVDDGELVELIRAWERLAAWAAAGQLAAIAELARRRPRDLLDRSFAPLGACGPAAPDAGHPADGRGPMAADAGQLSVPAGVRDPVAPDAGHPGVPEVSEFAVDEIAAALRLSRTAAGIRLHTAVELTRLPATASALRAGELDVPKVRAVVDAVSVLDAPTAGSVEARVLPRAGRQTVGQLRASLSRAVLAVDPAAVEVRHERAVADREVRLRPLRDGVAELWALLPADSAVAIYSRIDRLARCAPAGDPHSMDARRADALIAAVLTPGSSSTALPAPVALAAANGTALSAVVGEAASSEAGTSAGSAAASGTALSAVVGEAAPSAVGTSTTGPAAPAADRSAGGVGGGPAVVATVHVTVAAATALGLDAEPGELAGHGPVPASMARRLAGTGTWRKVTTDPVTGVVVDVGRTAYTPSAALADLVRARDRTCRFPGCRQPARRCDLDHVVPWPAGPTTAANLAALCRHHHRLKHQTPWTVRAGPDGDLLWTTPTGHRYRTSPAS